MSNKTTIFLDIEEHDLKDLVVELLLLENDPINIDVGFGDNYAVVGYSFDIEVLSAHTKDRELTDIEIEQLNIIELILSDNTLKEQLHASI